MKKRRIAILGSTGSIGTQALDVIRQHPDVFEVELLTANNSSELLIKQALEFDANNVVICNESKYAEVADALQPHGVKVFSGMDSICDLMTSDSIDMVLTALVGFSGLRPTIAAITAGKPIALANKETLVAGGSLVMDLAMTMKTPILPVDSEHSAIFQCLLCAGGNPIRKIHLTASGGPFRTWSREDIAKATFHEALKHPQWNMGDKITIDSATMMNKGFEMIEARWLFDTAPADIEVVVHPQSIIHSMVEFEDGAVIAQMGHPDMREPIQFALSFPKRLTLNNRKLDFTDLGTMTFEKPDPEKFPCLGLASAAISKGGNIPCAMNAANEAANKAYRNAEIAFYDIPEIISEVMAGTAFIAKPSLDDILETDREAFARAKEIIGRK
ncbi:MAG: 1-deoxy-D-xylulose-5-phosphate reductoisomerase [Candidatus Cryptobacteroides sp.]|nr:1-deoxy-D-xylulose-5-phosphate reductoisomerase [Candidatus Cryptobacteroides sp.]